MFYDRFLELCNEHGLSPSFVVKEIGLSKPNVTYWKNGSMPSSTTLQKLADYFGVSVDYLIGNNVISSAIDIAMKSMDSDLNGQNGRNSRKLQDRVVFDTSKIVDALNVTLEREKRKDRYIKAFDMLNDVGQEIAVDRVEELTEIPKYQLHHDPSEE